MSVLVFLPILGPEKLPDQGWLLRPKNQTFSEVRQCHIFGFTSLFQICLHIQRYTVSIRHKFSNKWPPHPDSILFHVILQTNYQKSRRVAFECTNFHCSPQRLLTSLADHFCSSQSKKKPQKNVFFATKKWNKIKFNCARSSRLQRRRKIAILHLISRWSSNESPSCLSCYLFLDSITLNNEWSLWAVRWFPAICDAKRFSCNFGFFAFLPSKVHHSEGCFS